jgi:hypothetical protein
MCLLKAPMNWPTDISRPAIPWIEDLSSSGSVSERRKLAARLVVF